MPWSTCSRLVQTKMGKKGFPTETPDRFWPFWWPVVGGDTFSSLEPILGKNVAMLPSLKLTARGGEYEPKMCRLCKRYLWGGGISASSYQPRHRNTRNRTDLALRPKATGNDTTLLIVAQEMYDRIALMAFLCRFPSWAYAWRWCRCCHLLASIMRRYVASGMYVCDDFDEKL